MFNLITKTGANTSWLTLRQTNLKHTDTKITVTRPETRDRKNITYPQNFKNAEGQRIRASAAVIKNSTYFKQHQNVLVTRSAKQHTKQYKRQQRYITIERQSPVQEHTLPPTRLSVLEPGVRFE